MLLIFDIHNVNGPFSLMVSFLFFLLALLVPLTDILPLTTIYRPANEWHVIALTCTHTLYLFRRAVVAHAKLNMMS